MTRIYVACLAAYNAGYLHGKWLDLNDYTDTEQIHKDISHMLAKSPVEDAEEFAIHDYESPLPISEYTPIERVWAVHEALEEVGDEADAFAAFVKHFCRKDDDMDDVRRDFENQYRQQWDSFEDFAHAWLYETDEQYKAAYDGNRMWRPEINMSDFVCDFEEVDSPAGVWVFDPNA